MCIANYCAPVLSSHCSAECVNSGVETLERPRSIIGILRKRLRQWKPERHERKDRSLHSRNSLENSRPSGIGYRYEHRIAKCAELLGSKEIHGHDRMASRIG